MAPDVDFRLLYQQDKDFAAFSDKVLMAVAAQNEDWLRFMYAAYQAGSEAQAVAAMINFMQKFGPFMPPQQQHDDPRQ